MTLPHFREAQAPVTSASNASRLIVFLVLAVSITWPAWINGSPLLFYDSPGYIQQGEAALEGAASLLLRSDPAPAEADSTITRRSLEAAAASASFIRSLGYSTFAYLSSLSPLGFFGIVLAQSLVVAGVIALVAGREAFATGPAWIYAAGACLLLTPLPFYASYLMPDVLAAIPMLVGLLIVRGLDDLGWSAFLFVLGAATFAAVSHYGHLPLTLAVGIGALAIIALQRRLTLGAIVLAIAPALLAGGLNAAGSKVAFEETSVAPKRMPLLLARSIADGPALWYLEETCPDRPYAICEVFESGIPRNLGVLLWSEEGMLKRATPEQTRRIREEEFEILGNAFLAYPVQQTWSLGRNALLQLGMIGTEDFSWGHLVYDDTGTLRRQSTGREGFETLGWIHIGSTLGAIGLIAAFALRDGLTVGRREREMLAVAALGLLANAAIFGGLSAPVDRYQSRVIWIIPLLAALFWLARRGRREPAGG
jgi:hypothetical protein